MGPDVSVINQVAVAVSVGRGGTGGGGFGAVGGAHAPIARPARAMPTKRERLIGRDILASKIAAWTRTVDATR